MNEEQLNFLEPIFQTFENEDIKNFAEDVCNNFPEYIWSVPASSTLKYHPSYACTYMGLMKHQVAVVRFMNFFFELDQYKKKFDSRQRDLLRTAALVHDGRKSGSQEDYEKSKYTKFEHPLLMAKEILKYKDKDVLSFEELKYMASAITKHMGQWSTDKRSTITLPTPNDEASEFLHLADYLASRKCLNMSFDEYEIPKEEPKEVDINTYTMPFGKWSGTLLKDVPKDYIKWLSTTELKEPLKSAVAELTKSN